MVIGKTNGLELSEVATLFVYDDFSFVLCDKLFKSFDQHFKQTRQEKSEKNRSILQRSISGVFVCRLMFENTLGISG